MLVRILSLIVVVHPERGIIATRCNQAHLVVCHDIVIIGAGRSGSAGCIVGIAEILVNRDVAVDMARCGGHCFRRHDCVLFALWRVTEASSVERLVAQCQC